MSNLQVIKGQINNLIDLANNTTGNGDTNLTDGVNSLISGYGQGATLQNIAITENGTYRPEGFDGFSEVVVNVASGGGSTLPDAEGMVF